MRRYRFRIVNVFAESALAGNALCVFEDATGLSPTDMQALAGGLVTSFLLELTVYPAIFAIWKGRSARRRFVTNRHSGASGASHPRAVHGR